MSSYAITVPKLPKGFELSEKIRDAFAAAAQRHGISVDIAQAIYNDVSGVALADFQAHDADTSRQVGDTTSILRDRFGANFDQKMASARAALEQLGLGQDGLMALEIAIGAPNAIERLVQIGDRLAGSRNTTTSEATETSMQQQTNNLPRSLEAIAHDRAVLYADKDWLARFKDPRHPLHRDAVAQQHRLAAEEAALHRAAAKPARALGAVQAEIAQLQGDREFVRRLGSPVDPLRDPPGHRQRLADQQKWDNLMSELHAAQRAARPAGADRRDALDAMHADPEAMAALGNRAAINPLQRDHQKMVDATDKHDRLVAENSAAAVAAGERLVP